MYPDKYVRRSNRLIEPLKQGRRELWLNPKSLEQKVDYSGTNPCTQTTCEAPRPICLAPDKSICLKQETVRPKATRCFSLCSYKYRELSNFILISVQKTIVSYIILCMTVDGIIYF